MHAVNFEDPVVKTVGRRSQIADPVSYGFALQANLGRHIYKGMEKGLYKFTSHEEADQWMMKHLLKTARS